MKIKQVRIITIILLVLIVPIGFYTKVYSGPANIWVNNSLGGFFYEVFWILVVFFLWPKLKPLIIAFGVFMLTCIIEFLQLWHPPILEAIRDTFIGKTVLGNSFNTADFPYYFLGSLCGYFILKMINKRHKRIG